MYLDPMTGAGLVSGALGPITDRVSSLCTMEDVQEDRQEKRLVEYADRPLEFFEEVLGLTAWEKQVEIVEKVLAHGETWVRAGHGVGKTTIAAMIAEWWFSCRGYSVITTAPSGHQVKTLLWQQGIRTHRINARRKLPGRCLETEIKVDERPDWFARGFSTDKPERAQGPHLDNLLIIVDEAAGIPDWLWNAIKGWMTNDGVRLLSIGNPSGDRTSQFYRAFHERSGDVATVHVDSEACPFVPKEWVDERAKEWGRESAEFAMKVKGEFPPESDDKACPMPWIQEGFRLWHELPATPEPIVKAAWDVAGKGKDRNALVALQGSRVRVVRYWREPDILVSAREVFGWLRSLPKEHRPKWLIVDATGQGEGAYRKLDELWKLPEYADSVRGCNLVGLDYGGSADSPTEFHRKVDELFGLLRRALNPDSSLEDRIALPPDDDLPAGLSSAKIAAQLNARKYGFTAKGRFYVESKRDLRKRKVGSPDVADAIAALMHQPKVTTVTWFSTG